MYVSAAHRYHDPVVCTSRVYIHFLLPQIYLPRLGMYACIAVVKGPEIRCGMICVFDIYSMYRRIYLGPAYFPGVTASPSRRDVRQCAHGE